MPYGNRPFYIGDVAPTITTSQYEQNNFIIEMPTKIIDGFNMDKDGMSARTVKSQYYKTSAANLIRENSMGATGVIEITPQISVMGNYLNSEHRVGNIYNIDGIAPTVMENHGKVICVALPSDKENEQ